MSIPGDHVGMTKFPSLEDVGYQRVSGELWIWARDVNKIQQSAHHEALRPETFSVLPDVAPDEQQFRIESGSAEDNNRHFYQGSMQNVGQVFQGSNVDTVNFVRR